MQDRYIIIIYYNVSVMYLSCPFNKCVDLTNEIFNVLQSCRIRDVFRLEKRYRQIG